MSSDDYFDDSGQLDTAFLTELDAIEAAHVNATQRHPYANSYSPLLVPSTIPNNMPLSTIPASSDIPLPSNSHKAAAGLEDDDSYDRFFDDIDPIELQKMDKDVEEAYQPRPAARGPSGFGVTRQLTLFGDVLQEGPSKPTRSSQHKTQAVSPRTLFGKKARKVKHWDHTAFAKSGWKSAKGKGNAKPRDAGGDESDEDIQSSEEFEQYPAPKYASSSPPPFKHVPDPVAAQTWIYPTNKEKRDYQFNIVRNSLFENSLVSLPTGLGKTFIAGVIMLNYYRWFPEGKVIFVAPTKPLVAQQIDACHQTCGIPGGDAAELTGQTAIATRVKLWAEKRVFFMTPQTLMNDLKTENCDPTDIVLLVIDEAHKATGNYAYTQVVRYLMAKNGHFRVLALTATPSGKPETVQQVIDALHISNIEIRDECSLDLRQYILPKIITPHIIKMTPDVIKIRDMLAKFMEKSAKRFIDTGLIHNLNMVTLHHYRCTALIQQYTKDGTGKKFSWVYSILKKLSSLARAMGYLLESSIVMCHNEIHGFSTEVEKDGTKYAGFRSEPLFQNIVKELERQHNLGFSLHPKLDKLQSLAVDYFARATIDTGGAASLVEGDVPEETKMMVFSNFRSSVDEIVDLLNTHQPLIRATRFIGQGTDKYGKKGIAQKEQLEVIKKFKGGVYNVLVSTSIGEEGLDIGAVDMIICYDAQKTPIRMLQRIGRTGRKRAGRVEVLLAEGREESNWEKSVADHNSVQRSIIQGDSLELFADVERLLPDHFKPTCLEDRMAIEEFVRDRKPLKTSASTDTSKGTKRKRNTDVARNIPEGATNGFIPSSKLVSKGGAKRRKLAPRKGNTNEVDDDADNETIQNVIHDPPVSKPKGKRNVKVTSKSKKGARVNKARKKSLPVTEELSLSQLDRKIQDDSDDMEIELGVRFSSSARSLSDIGKPAGLMLPSPSASPISIHSSPEVHTLPATNDSSLPNNQSLDEDHSWLLDSDEDIRVVEITQSTDFCKSSKPQRFSPMTPPARSNFKHSPLSHVPSEKKSIQSLPESTFAIRRPGIRRKRPRVSPSPTFPPRPEKAQLSSPVYSPARLPIRSKKRRVHMDSQTMLEMLDLEAEVSGDESIGNSSDYEVESESDQRFVQELAPTQASPSYDQISAYRHSLFTQAPGHEGPQFTSKPLKRGAFGPQRQHVNVSVSSSPHRDQLPDQYSMDSFVVEDDDDVLLVEDSHSSAL